MHLVQQSGQHKAFSVYLTLKASSNGHRVLSREDVQDVMAIVGIKTKASFKKHMGYLLRENWIGYNTISGTYYIRGINFLRNKYNFYGVKSVSFNVQRDSKSIKQFVEASIISETMYRKIHGRRAVIIKKAGRLASNKEGALQGLIADKIITPYCGLSNELIGKILGVSKSQADRSKKLWVKSGYIKAVARYNSVFISGQPDFLAISHLPGNRRYKVKKVTKNASICYEFLERTYDEIIPCMEFSNQKSNIKKLKNRIG